MEKKSPRMSRWQAVASGGEESGKGVCMGVCL